ncbi:iron complex outermembrane recepter protein [Franzmannia pantelleriensis]|uniref:Iron complex outermembrane recepter protein n=1 Tax=Franzmannia pantelleriensis TaxID=48727 RepID=A0A1G9RA23_9GAMM|nr:TonB-dependent siderophore receptor [Halomonas pantelleriensis]SDM20172.1 iron complex outermembrane recepter protein [Halomonas pantelleriensis]
MRKPHPLSLAITMLASAIASTAWGQDEEQAQPLDTLTVTAQQAATKVTTPFVETPQAVSLVSREDMDTQGARTVQRATNYTPGVFSNQVGASNRYDYLVLRGFSDGSLSNTFLDGLKVMGDSNSYSSMSVDPWFLDSIEVVRGPASVLYGRASPGGVVALTSKRPAFEPGGELRLSLGNNQQRSAAFDLTGPLGDENRVAYRLTGLASAADTQFGPVEEERYAIAPSLTWDVTDVTSLTLYAYLQQDPEGGYHSGVPYEGSVVDRNGRRIANTFFDGEAAYDKFKRTQRMLGYELEHHVNDEWRARQRLRYLNADVVMDQVYGFGWAPGSDSELTRYFAGGDESLEAWTLDNQLEANLSGSFIDHTLLLGVDYQQRDNHVDWPSGAFPNLDAFDPQYGADPIAMYPPTREQHELRQTGVYLQDQMALGNWRLTLGGRYDWVDITNTNLDSGERSELNDTQFSGRAGLLYLFDSGVAPYLSYSTAFTPTSFIDAEGDLLPPMEGEQLEAGLKYQPAGGDDRYSVSLFRINQENVATKEQPTDPYRAVGEIQSQGVELEAYTQLTDRVRLQANYSYTDITYRRSDDGNQGNRAIYAPRHQASLWGHYAFDSGALDGLDAGLGVRYYADIQADRANTARVPEYTLVDATLGYDLGRLGYDGLSARLNVTNLTDEEYVAACNSLEYCYFGAERGVLASLSYAF